MTIFPSAFITNKPFPNLLGKNLRAFAIGMTMSETTYLMARFANATSSPVAMIHERVARLGIYEYSVGGIPSAIRLVGRKKAMGLFIEYAKRDLTMDESEATKAFNENRK